MKKIIAILAVFALTASCFASSITITAATDTTSDTLKIGYTGATGDKPIGVSMKVTVSGTDLKVNAASDVTGYNHKVYIDWVKDNTTATCNPTTGVSSSASAHPLAKLGVAGAMALPTAGGADFALCMGRLAPGSLPGASGDLVKIKFSGLAALACATVTLSADATRGGIVDQNGVAMTVTFPGAVSVCGVSGICKGDLDGDGFITTTDMANIVNKLIANGGDDIDPLNPLWNAAADVDGDGVITTTDMANVVNALIAAGGDDIACPGPF